MFMERIRKANTERRYVETIDLRKGEDLLERAIADAFPCNVCPSPRIVSSLWL